MINYKVGKKDTEKLTVLEHDSVFASGYNDISSYAHLYRLNLHVYVSN